MGLMIHNIQNIFQEMEKHIEEFEWEKENNVYQSPKFSF